MFLLPPRRERENTDTHLRPGFTPAPSLPGSTDCGYPCDRIAEDTVLGVTAQKHCYYYCSTESVGGRRVKPTCLTTV